MAAQITAVIIFLIMFSLIITEKNTTAHSHDHLQHRDYHSRLWCLYAQCNCTLGHPELSNFYIC